VEKMKMALGAASFLGPGITMNWYMLHSWQQGDLTTGQLVFIFNTSWNITMMVWLVGLQLPDLFKEIGICKQALSIIQDDYDIKDAPKAKELQIKHGSI